MTSCIYPGTAVFLAGLLAGINLGYSALLSVVALLMTGIVLWQCWRKCRHYLLLAAAVLFFGAVGIISGAHIQPEPQQLLQSNFNREVTAYGVIDPATVKQSDKGTSFVLKCRCLKDGEKMIGYTQKLRVFTADKIKQYDKYVYCRGTLQQLSSFRNPGSFDAEKWNHINGIGGMISKGKVTMAQADIGWCDQAALLNVALKKKIMQDAGSETGNILAGMVFGGSGGIDEETRRIFSDNGLTHILSVSGTHMVLLTGFLMLVLRNVRRRIKCIIISVMLILYGAVCGFQPPVLRALCMSIVLLYGGSAAEKGIILCMTGMIMLIFKPVWIYDIGFQLSFGAAAGLIWLLPKIKTALSAYLPLWLSEAAGVTIAAQLSVLPLLLSYFYQFSLISVISNIILVPVLETATILTLLGILLSIIPALGDFLIYIAGFFTRQAIVQGGFLSSIPGSVVTVGAMPMWVTVIYYFLLIMIMDLPCVQFLKNKERKFFIACLSVLLLVELRGVEPCLNRDFTVYFLDVGQGDCAVITTADDKTAVIDTGGLKNYDTGSRILVPFLHSLSKTKVDLLLLSHGDYDHAGGAAGLAKYITIDKIILGNKTKCSAAEKQLLANTSGKAEQAAAGAVYALGKDTALRILSAAPGAEGNDASIVAAAESGGHRILFTGDISEEREELLHNIGKTDVLKVAHHGSKYSSGEYFLAQARPDIAVISAGQNNSYGHPHAETLARLRDAGCRIMRTDLMGAVKVTFDGNKTKCYSYVYQKEFF